MNYDPSPRVNLNISNDSTYAESNGGIPSSRNSLVQKLEQEKLRERDFARETSPLEILDTDL